MVLLLFLITAAVVKLITLQMLGVGGADPLGYWGNGLDFPYSEGYHLFHRSVRFGTIVPVWITQKIFGTHPLVYYIAPFAASMTMLYFLFKISERILGTFPALYVGVLTLIFPEMLKSGSHPRVSTFASLFFFIGVYLLVRYYDEVSEKKQIVYLIVAGLMVFLMYMAKEDILFFMPVLMLFVWYSRKNFRHLLLFSLVPFVLFLGETVAYAAFTDFSYGRLGVLQSHMGSLDNLPLKNYGEMVLTRFTTRYTDIYLLIVMIISLVLSPLLVYKKRKDSLFLFMLFLFLVYMFFFTFLPKSLDPVVPLNNYKERYYTPVIPFMMMIVVESVRMGYLRLRRKTKERSRLALILAVVLAFTGGLGFIYGYQKMLYDRITLNIFATNPLYLVSHYQRMLDQAGSDNYPVVFKSRSQAERFIPLLRKIHAYRDQGHTLTESCAQYGVTIDMYRQYREKQEHRIYSGERMMDTFFSKGFFELPSKEIFYNERYYKVVFFSEEARERSLDSFPFMLYVPYRPFGIYEIKGLKDIEKVDTTY